MSVKGKRLRVLTTARGPPSILLKNSIILELCPDDTITNRKADVLIEDGIISRIEPNITTSNAAEEVDCCSKLISPGMINTHLHTWQTQLKGRHANDLLMDYMVKGNFAGLLYTPEDIELGQLCGALESIDSGTTTIVDHFHAIGSEDHFRAGFKGLERSGIRAIFCPSIVTRAEAYTPKFTLKGPQPDWFMPVFHEYLAQKAPESRLVSIGLAHDAVTALSKEEVVKTITDAREKGVGLFTFHLVGGFGASTPLSILSEYGLLGPDMLFSHATNIPPNEYELIRSSGAKVSTTPSTELHMGLGESVMYARNLDKQCSLGVDCHSFTAASILGEARLGLAWARGIRSRDLHAKGETTKAALPLVHEVFNQATIQAARCIGMEDQIGNIAVGKRADLVIWDTMSPSMTPVAVYDPVVALIMHSSPRDIDAVMVGGVWRKYKGKLVLQVTAEGPKEWSDLAKDLMESYRRIEAKAEKIDYTKAQKEMFEAWSAH